MKKLFKDELSAIRFLLLCCFVLIITVLAWQSDDAYHGYVMAKHLAEGNGFVYNIGQRASATTGPLYTLIIAVFHMITREMFFTSLFVNILLSAIAFSVVIYGMAKSREQVVFAFLAMTGSSAFVSYTTSGLENCLMFALAALWVKLYFDHEVFNTGRMLLLAVIFALLAMARMDAVLMLIPAIVYVYLMKRDKVSFLGAVGLTAAGLLPFILWEIFSLFYFGFLVPNTAFVKLGTDISKLELLKKGIWYVYYTALNDIMVLIVPAVFVIAAVISKKWKNIHLALGVLLYGAYVLYIGGDFMMGRHFTVIHIISIAGILNVMNNMAADRMKLAALIKKVFAGVVTGSIVYAVTFVPLIGEQYLVNGDYAPGAAISDERAYYAPTTGLWANVRSLLKEGRMCIEDTWNYQSTDEVRANGWRGTITENSPGILVYYNSDLYLNDTYCLGDPFLSKLPAIKQETWRVGHLRRRCPEGYRETVMYGENVIENEDLSKYYDVIIKMTEGKLTDPERIRTVIDWNLGKYEYLLDSYKQELMTMDSTED